MYSENPRDEDEYIRYTDKFSHDPIARGKMNRIFNEYMADDEIEDPFYKELRSPAMIKKFSEIKSSPLPESKKDPNERNIFGEKIKDAIRREEKQRKKFVEAGGIDLDDPNNWDKVEPKILDRKSMAGRRVALYTPAYVAADLAPIGIDAVGTAGAAAVGFIPLAVAAGVIYGGATYAKKQYDKNKIKTSSR
jgi:hypothetical protein